MKFPSASRLQRAIECPGSSFLPVVIEPKGGSADLGTRLHQVFDALFNEGLSKAMVLAKELDCLEEAMRIDRSLFEQGLDNIRTEVAFEYDVFHKDHKDYGRNGFDKFQYGSRIRGVADLVGVSGGILTVIDWKTGFGATPDSKSNWQLIIACLVFRSLGYSRNAIGKIINTSTNKVDQCEYDESFLDGKEEELFQFAKKYSPDESRGIYKVGDHCTYCPSWLFCPAQTNAIQRMLSTEAVLPITEANAVEAIERLKDLNSLSKRAEKGLRGYIELIGGRLVAPDGKVYIPAAAEGKIKKESK